MPLPRGLIPTSSAEGRLVGEREEQARDVLRHGVGNMTG
jgi:hypothetical protein